MAGTDVDSNYACTVRPRITRFGVILALLLIATPLVGGAQQAGKVYRLGFLGGVRSDTSGGERLWGALLEGLREFGYVEGENIVVERRYTEGKEDRLPALAADLVRLKVDVIVAGATQPVHAAVRATTTIPIVMPNHSDPVGSGLVASLARPGGNVTGLSIINPELTAKRLELLKDALPGIGRVAVLSNPTHQAHPSMLSEVDVAARGLGLQILRLQARSADDYERAFSVMARERAEAVLVLGDVMFWLHRARIAELAAKRHLPTMFSQREHVEAGGLMSYGADLADNYRRSASYVAKILRGASPADLPIEQPVKFELVINLKTAKAFGLTIPASVLARANQLLE
jgi:putative ABC transport system substrate-binding protein